MGIFKILSLDGGGIKGLFASTILEEIENSFNIKLSEFFDLLIGTSTGSIIASAVALNIPINKISKLYEEKGKEIFSRRKFSFGCFKSKYKNRKLKNILETEFGDKRLGEINKPLMIVSSDLLNGNVYVHKSNYLSKIEAYTRDKNTKLAEAILSSCMAPSYFNPIRLDNNYLLCDGGIWANNPSLLGLVEAMSKFKKEINQINIMSIGTGGKKVYFKDNKSWGLCTGWKFQKLVSYLFSISSKGVTNMSSLLLKENYIRVDSDIDYNIDDVSNLDNLKSYANKCFLDNKSKIEQFLNSIGKKL